MIETNSIMPRTFKIHEIPGNVQLFETARKVPFAKRSKDSKRVYGPFKSKEATRITLRGGHVVNTGAKARRAAVSARLAAKRRAGTLPAIGYRPARRTRRRRERGPSPEV
jgi:hypothetical protein